MTEGKKRKLNETNVLMTMFIVLWFCCALLMGMFVESFGRGYEEGYVNYLANHNETLNAKYNQGYDVGVNDGYYSGYDYAMDNIEQHFDSCHYDYNYADEKQYFVCYKVN